MEKLFNYDFNELIFAFLRKHPLSSHNTDSFNDFLNHGLEHILTKVFSIDMNIPNTRTITDEDKEIELYKITGKFRNVVVSDPYIKIVNQNSETEIRTLTPQEAKRNQQVYSSPLSATLDIEIKAITYTGQTKIRQEQIKVDLGKIPIMTGCNKCITSKMTKIEKFQSCEDPHNNGGTFEIGLYSWIMNSFESRAYNIPHTFNNYGYENEQTRQELISKPGNPYENSSEFIIRYLIDNNLTLTITNQAFEGVNFPFYIIYRLLGMTSDEEIFNNIIHGYSYIPKKNNTQIIMGNKLAASFKAEPKQFAHLKTETDQATLITEIGKIMSRIKFSSQFDIGLSQDDEVVVRYILQKQLNLLSNLDKFFLPHIGTTIESRHYKLRYLSNLIRIVYLTNLGYLSPTDRDSLANKRENSPGVCFGRMLKTQGNTSIFQRIKSSISDALNNFSFSTLPIENVVKQSIDQKILEKAIINSISTGEKEISINGINTSMKNRISTEMAQRKNMLYIVASLRNVKLPNASNKNSQTERAFKIRAVHPTFCGKICPIQSADTGDPVGMIKQLAITAIISKYYDYNNLKSYLLADKLVQEYNKVHPHNIYYDQLALIKINGDPIGYTKDPCRLILKYKELRRGWDLDTQTRIDNNTRKLNIIGYEVNIHYNIYLNEIDFWTDAGRIMYPVMIVRNNTELDPIGQTILQSKYDAIKNTGFMQKTMINSQILKQLKAREINFDYLLDQGIIEFLGTEEELNSRICAGPDEFFRSQHDPINIYTHMVAPIQQFGLAVISSPYFDRMQAARSTFQSNQSRSRSGIPGFNWPFLRDKDLVISFYNQYPVVSTLLDKLVVPGGYNTYLAISTEAGYNQEDSLAFNTHASNRGFMQNGITSFIKIDLGANELFQAPQSEQCEGISVENDYKHIQANGELKPGTMLTNRNQVICGKIVIKSHTLQPNEKPKKDTSITYKLDEPARHIQTIKLNNEDGSESRLIIYQHDRPTRTSDKFSTRSAQKGMMSLEHPEFRMPFNSAGIHVTMEMNPMAIPTRMTINQQIESCLGIIAGKRCINIDGTAFNEVSEPVIDQLLLQQRDIGPDGMQILYTPNGHRTRCMLGIVYIQRLNKYGVAEIYAANSTCTINNITKQPTPGKPNNGGLRLGEMEKDVFASHGTVRYNYEKFNKHSDSFDIYVCITCNNMATVNEESGLYTCKHCRSSKQEPVFAKVRSCWTSKMLINMAKASHINFELFCKDIELWIN
jgi:DNA-directed RNA polymerase II subunit RPB2